MEKFLFLPEAAKHPTPAETPAPARPVGNAGWRMASGFLQFVQTRL